MHGLCVAVFQEEVAGLRRKLERAKKIELAGTADEVLMEEIKEYKVSSTQVHNSSLENKILQSVPQKCNELHFPRFQGK